MKINSICYSPSLQTSTLSFKGNVPSYKQLNYDSFEKVIDIDSRGIYPAGILSNFTESHFTIDGVKVNSMEGFLQSLKTADPEEQKNICTMVGIKAKRAGNKLKAKEGYNPNIVFWNNNSMARDSREYQNLLKKAFEAKFDYDAKFRKALAETKGSKLTHSIGKSSIYQTILTEQEFVDLLHYLRDQYSPNKIKVLVKTALGKLI